jgi:hypothetical protein
MYSARDKAEVLCFALGFKNFSKEGQRELKKNIKHGQQLWSCTFHKNRQCHRYFEKLKI